MCAISIQPRAKGSHSARCFCQKLFTKYYKRFALMHMQQCKSQKSELREQKENGHNKVRQREQYW